MTEAVLIITILIDVLIIGILLIEAAIIKTPSFRMSAGIPGMRKTASQ